MHFSPYLYVHMAIANIIQGFVLLVTVPILPHTPMRFIWQWRSWGTRILSLARVSPAPPAWGDPAQGKDTRQQLGPQGPHVAPGRLGASQDAIPGAQECRHPRQTSLSARIWHWHTVAAERCFLSNFLRCFSLPVLSLLAWYVPHLWLCQRKQMLPWPQKLPQCLILLVS